MPSTDSLPPLEEVLPAECRDLLRRIAAYGLTARVTLNFSDGRLGSREFMDRVDYGRRDAGRLKILTVEVEAQ